MRGIIFFALALCISMSASSVHAQELSVTPAVIDKDAKPRDIIKETITILNTTERKLNLYPSVNDINVVEGEQDFSAATNADDRSISLANWIELSRGVIELSPGEEKSIPFVIRVHLAAEPDDYHASISFSEGSTRETAEARGPLATIDVNVDVTADVKETLQLNKFFTDRFFLSGDDILFNYQLENIGNQDLVPKGEIRVYDRTGKEIAAIDVNSDKQTISPDQVSQLASVWGAASGFGRYKAFLNVDFGASQRASVQDTIYFWVLPWQQLAGLLGATLVAIVFLALYFHRMFELRHQARLAHALSAHGVTPVAPAAPVQAVEKPRRFGSLFKRSHAPASIAAPVPAPTLEPVHELPKQKEMIAEAPQTQQAIQPPVREVRAPQAHAIDLKNVHAPTVRVHTEAHVINLKGKP